MKFLQAEFLLIIPDSLPMLRNVQMAISIHSFAK